VSRRPSAIFSPDGRYRWILRWPTDAVSSSEILTVIGANPSKAGAPDGRGGIVSDPTVSRLRSLAFGLGYGWLCMVNARSYVATDPKDMPPDPDAIGDETDEWIDVAVRSAGLVVLAYGHLAGTRAQRVLEIVHAAGKVPHALALTADGTPRHPRGVPSSARPFPYRREVAHG
jgi:hypothetical protein